MLLFCCPWRCTQALRALTESVAERMRGTSIDVFVHHSLVSLDERQSAEARFAHRHERLHRVRVDPGARHRRGRSRPGVADDVRKALMARLPNYRLSKFQDCLPEPFALEMVESYLLCVGRRGGCTRRRDAELVSRRPMKMAFRCRCWPQLQRATRGGGERYPRWVSLRRQRRNPLLEWCRSVIDTGFASPYSL